MTDFTSDSFFVYIGFKRLEQDESHRYLMVLNLFILAYMVLQAAMGTMDYIIDTVSAVHPLAPLLGLLKLNGKLVTVGLPDKPLELPIFSLVKGKPSIISIVLQQGLVWSNQQPKAKSN